jgi:hypothetical protein
MQIERLIANDPDDCRGLLYVLLINGYVVWIDDVYDAETRITNTIVCYVPKDIESGFYTEQGLATKVPCENPMSVTTSKTVGRVSADDEEKNKEEFKPSLDPELAITLDDEL